MVYWKTLTLEAPIPQNGQTHSNNSSAKLPTNCLSVLGHFINLALKGLMRTDIDATSWGWRVKDKKLELIMMRNESQTNIFNMLNKYLLSLNFLIHPYFSSFSLCL